MGIELEGAPGMEGETMHGQAMNGEAMGGHQVAGVEPLTQELAHESLGSEGIGELAPSSQAPIAELLAALEALSRSHPDRVLRLKGSLPSGTWENGPDGLDPAGASSGSETPSPLASEPFELLIFRGFSSLTTHPTAFDPDRPALPEGAHIMSAELLAAPLDPDGGMPLVGPVAAANFLAAEHWLP